MSSWRSDPGRGIAFLAAVVCLAGALPGGQAPQPPQPNQQQSQQQTEQKTAPASQPGTVIKTETRLVLVDAVVTDKKGNYIRDLTAKDFRVWEDKKEQTITSFSFGADPGFAPAAQRRYLVLFFDNSTMPLVDQMRARQAAASFIEKNAGPGRMVAVVNFVGNVQVTQNFTDDVERLKTAVSGTKMSAVSPNQTASLGMPSLGRVASDFGARNMVLALRSIARNLAPVPGRKSLVLFTGGFAVTPERLSEITATIDACNKANVALYPIDVRGLTAGPSMMGPGAALEPERDTGQTARAVAAADAARPGPMAALPGCGGAMTRGRPCLQMIAFYSGGSVLLPQGQRPGNPGPPPGAGGGGRPPGGGAPPSAPPSPPPGSGGSPGGRPGPTNPPGSGTRPPGDTGPRTQPGYPGYDRSNSPYDRPRVLIPRFPESGSMTNRDVMHMLADGTGGFVIENTNSLITGLEKIGKEQNEYYILGYRPPEALEESCHALRVKVERGGTRVRSRSGYCDVKPRDLLAGKPIERELELQVDSLTPGRPGASMQTSFFYSSANIARVNVALELPTEQMQFEKQKGKFQSAVNILGIAYTPSGTVGARFSDTLQLQFEDKKEVEEFKKKPLRYENQFDTASGQYTLKLAFKSGRDVAGKLEMPLLIEPYDGRQFSMSGVAFSKEVRRISDSGVGMETALIEDRTPLMVGDIQLIPCGSNRFKQTEPAFIYFEVYEPLLVTPDPQKPVAVGVRIRILNRATGEQKNDSGIMKVAVPPAGGNPVIPVGRKIPVSAFAPGSYRLELTALNSAGASIKRLADFEIE